MTEIKSGNGEFYVEKAGEVIAKIQYSSNGKDQNGKELISVRYKSLVSRRHERDHAKTTDVFDSIHRRSPALQPRIWNSCNEATSSSFRNYSKTCEMLASLYERSICRSRIRSTSCRRILLQSFRTSRSNHG